MSDLLNTAFEKIHITLDEAQHDKLLSYMEGILEYNRNINLTSITDPEEFVMKHYVDSAVICQLKEYQNAEKIIDMGTGGGFPGIPLAAVSPEKSFTLADSLKKRLNVIENLCGRIGIANVETVHGRAEDIGQNPAFRQQYDLCVSRAVANLSVLAEYCLPLVKTGGYFIAYKGPDIEEELGAAKKAIRILGGKTDRVEELHTEMFHHNLIVIRKVSETPSRYPRRAGTPGKSPIR